MAKNNNNRADRQPGHRKEYERNKKRILRAQHICGICGQPVDKSLKFPHPDSPTVDHIIPVSKGGHPSDIDNLQLAHFRCNRAKADKLRPAFSSGAEAEPINSTTPEGLPLTINWYEYQSNENNANNFEELKADAEERKASGLILTARNGTQRAQRNGTKL